MSPTTTSIQPRRRSTTAKRISIPRRLPAEVFDALRAVTGNGPSFVYEEVRANVRHRLTPDPCIVHHRTLLENVWRVAFHDAITHHSGREPDHIAPGGEALTHELARIATDEHMNRPSSSGRRSRRAVNAWLARALDAQT